MNYGKDATEKKLRDAYENYLITLAIVDSNHVGEDIEGYRVVANGDNVIEVASREIVDEVFLVLDDQRKNEIIEYAEQFAQMGVIVHVNIDLLDHLGAGYQREVTQIGNHYALSVAPRFFDFNKLVMKRIIDIVGAIVGLMITAVVMLFIAPAVKLESPGPLIFKQKRVGKNGRYFYIYKVRSMYQDAEARKAELMEKNEMKGFMFKMTDDPRITKVGKFIRSTSIDVLQTRMGVNSLLAGIIVNTALYSINIAIMDGASLLSLNKTQTVFSLMKTALAGTPLAGQYKLLTVLAAVVLIVLLLTLFLRTRMGLAIRATGNNPDMVRSSSINPAMTTTVGLCIAGSFTALSGCLLAQYQKAADINIGQGMVTIALASLLIGSTILGRGGIFLRAVGAVLGAVVFRLVYTVALRLDMPAFMLKLVSAVIVVLAISIPYLRTRLPVLRRRMQRKAG